MVLVGIISVNPAHSHSTIGLYPDMREATRDAVRHMTTFLGVEHGLDRVEAYMLCSVAGDLKLCEVVCSNSRFID